MYGLLSDSFIVLFPKIRHFERFEILFQNVGRYQKRN